MFFGSGWTEILIKKLTEFYFLVQPSKSRPNRIWDKRSQAPNYIQIYFSDLQLLYKLLSTLLHTSCSIGLVGLNYLDFNHLKS